MKHIPDTGPLSLDKDQTEARVIPPPLPSQFSLEICNLASDALIILDRDQRISYFNLSAAEMLGYLQEEAPYDHECSL